MGPKEVKGDVWGIPRGHQVGLMSLLMIHKAYACIQGIKIFIADRASEVVQEVLADLNNSPQ